MSSSPGKRLPVDRQYPLPEYHPIDKKQHTEKVSCLPLWAKKGNSVHIPAAEKAAQDTEVQRIEQQKSDRYVVKHRTKQLTLSAADVLCERCQQVSDTESRQRTHKAEDAELHVCHAFGADVDLNAKSHKVDLLKHAGEQGISS